MKQVKLARRGYLVISAIFYIAAAVCIVKPELSTKTVCVGSGLILIAYGIIKIIGYFSSDLYCLAFQYDLACGLLLIVLGIIVLLRWEIVQTYLLAGLGGLILVDNFLAIQMSYDAKRYGIGEWGAILIIAILTSCFAILLITQWTPTFLQSHFVAGIALLSEGVKNQYVVFYTVKIMNDGKPRDNDDD